MIMNDQYQHEFEHLLYQAQQLNQQVSDLLERMDQKADAAKIRQEDPHWHVFEKQREILHELRRVAEKYFVV